MDNNLTAMADETGIGFTTLARMTPLAREYASALALNDAMPAELLLLLESWAAQENKADAMEYALLQVVINVIPREHVNEILAH